MLVKQNQLDTRGCLAKLILAILPLSRFPLYSVLSRREETGGTAT